MIPSPAHRNCRIWNSAPNGSSDAEAFDYANKNQVSDNDLLGFDQSDDRRQTAPGRDASDHVSSTPD